MSENAASIALEQTPEGFVLRRTDTAGKTDELTLSAEDVLRLAQSAQRLRDHILAQRNPRGDSVSATVVTPVARIRLGPDALGESILLAMIDGSGAEMTFSLVPEVARPLAERLPVHLARIEAVKPTKQ
jgi:hypothetical protein